MQQVQRRQAVFGIGHEIERRLARLDRALAGPRTLLLRLDQRLGLDARRPRRGLGRHRRHQGEGLVRLLVLRRIVVESGLHPPRLLVALGAQLGRLLGAPGAEPPDDGAGAGRDLAAGRDDGLAGLVVAPPGDAEREVVERQAPGSGRRAAATQTGASPMGRRPISVPPPNRSWPSAPPRLTVKGQAPDEGTRPRPMEAASSEAGSRSRRSHQGLAGRWRTSFTAQTASATASMKLASPRLCRREIGDIGAGHAQEILHRPVGREIEGGIAPARRQQRHQIGSRQDEEENAERPPRSAGAGRRGSPPARSRWWSGRS